MSAASITPEFARWLDAATRGLPAEVRGWLRDELSAHYEDAVQDQLERGVSMEAAARSALAELGSARSVRRDFSETHLAERHYWVAAAASLIFPLALLAHVLLLLLGDSGLDVIVYDLLLLVPMLYVLRRLHTLFVLRFNLYVEARLRLIALGLIAMTLPEIFLQSVWLTFTHGIIGGLSPFLLSLLDTLVLIDWIGAVVLGIGLVWLAEALLSLKPRGLAVIRPFCAVALITGCAIALTSAASLNGRQDWFDFTWTAALVLGLLLHGLWALLFVRAARNDRPAFAE